MEERRRAGKSGSDTEEEEDPGYYGEHLEDHYWDDDY